MVGPRGYETVKLLGLLTEQVRLTIAWASWVSTGPENELEKLQLMGERSWCSQITKGGSQPAQTRSNSLLVCQ